MTTRTDLDRTLTAWLDAERPALAPDGLFEQIRLEVAHTARRPGWRVLDRWTWTATAARLSAAGRAIALITLVVLLVVALIAAVLLAGGPRPAPPFGLTRPGYIAFDTPEGVVLARGDGSDRHVLIPADGQSISPTWSRDGLTLALWHRAGASGPWDLVVLDATGANPRVLARGVTLRDREAALNQPSNLSWSPDERSIAFAGDVGSSSAIFVADLEAGSTRQIVDEALRAVDPAWAPDGSVIAFQSEATHTLHAVAPDGSGERQLGWLTGTFLWPEWSPDGSAIAVSADLGGNAEIFTVSANGSVVTNVSNDPAPDMSPSWSPDGARLAWGRAMGEGTRAWVVVANADGSGQVQLDEPADLAPPTWSPDGTRVFSYVVGEDDSFQSIVILDPAGVAPAVKVPAEGNVGNGNWQRLP
jgi:Tol biopolymer transport system component